jgi:hypothetical protein
MSFCWKSLPCRAWGALVLALLGLGLAACSETQSTCNCYDPSKLDSIQSFSVLKDSLAVDVMDDLSAYPKLETGKSVIQLQEAVQVECGEPRFSIRSSRDTLVVTSTIDSTRACVDWTAKFRYSASVTVIGKCNFVHFLNREQMQGNHQDTLLRI